jgi:hypothetical protein
MYWVVVGLKSSYYSTVRSHIKPMEELHIYRGETLSQGSGIWIHCRTMQSMTFCPFCMNPKSQLSLHFECTVMPKWLYESFCGTSVCPRCHVNSLFRLLHLTKNGNTQDFDALNLKRHLHEYEYTTSNNLWSCTGEVEMNDRSSANEGQLLLTPRIPEFGLLSSKSFIRLLINTKYKNVDNTPLVALLCIRKTISIVFGRQLLNWPCWNGSFVFVSMFCQWFQD